MPYAHCQHCGRDFFYEPSEPQWLTTLDTATGDFETGEPGMCSDCWHRGWYSSPRPLGSGDPDWAPRPIKLQFRLRTLFVLTAVAAVIVATVPLFTEPFPIDSFYQRTALITDLAAIVFAVWLIRKRHNAAMEAEPSKRKRRWYQFRLRTLLIVMLVAAIPCAMLGRKIARKRQERAATATIAKWGGKVKYDYEGNQDAIPPGPEWLRWIFGNDFFSDVVGVYFPRQATPDDSGLAAIEEELPQLRDLGLYKARITDDGLKHLNRLTQLESLNLDETQLTDKGMSHIKGLTKLKNLWLCGTKITDEGLVNLKGLTELRGLHLDDTEITDAGLQHLRGLGHLVRLVLSGTKVTDEGIADFKKAVPLCKVIY